MPLTPPIEQHWVDILPPAAPPTHIEPLALVIAAMVLSVLVATAIVFYRRPRQRAKRALRRLGHELREPRIDGKSTALAIARYVRLGLDQRRLQAMSVNGTRRADWESFVERLTGCCFAAETPPASELERMVQEALAWLDVKAERVTGQDD